MPNNLSADAVLNELQKDRKHWTAWKLTHPKALAPHAELRILAIEAAIMCVEAVRGADPTMFDRIADALAKREAA
jgi:hypothetical protein